MKEIYRSFEGKLDVNNQSGYIIEDGNDFYQVSFISVWTDQEDRKYRISKEIKFDFTDIDRISEIVTDIENGCYDSEKCQVLYNGKWYSGKTINKIQSKNDDYYWKRYV